MPEVRRTGFTLQNPAGLIAECHSSGGLRRLLWGPTSVTLWVGSELGPGPANLYLRRLGGQTAFTPLLGPGSPTRFQALDGQQLAGHGKWEGLEYTLVLRLATSAPAWLWHLWLRNRTANPAHLDVIYAQDVALAPYWALRLNEH